MMLIEPPALAEIRARMAAAPYVAPVAFFGVCLRWPGAAGPGDPADTRHRASAMPGPYMEVAIQEAGAFAPEAIVELAGLRFQIPPGLRPLLAGARLSYDDGRFALRAPDGGRITLPGM